jgi:hypothetical protein
MVFDEFVGFRSYSRYGNAHEFFNFFSLLLFDAFFKSTKKTQQILNMIERSKYKQTFFDFSGFSKKVPKIKELEKNANVIFRYFLS